MNDLKFAIQMELDGEAYYRQQASVKENKGIRSVCLLLANEEKRHGELLQKKYAGPIEGLADSNVLAEAKSIFLGLKNIKVDGIEKASQLDFYRIALEKEEESINLYSHYLAQSEDTDTKLLFEFLIKQEKRHYAILESFVDYVKRPEEWVENAEFGIREDY